MMGKYLAAAVIAVACAVSGCAHVSRDGADMTEQARQLTPVAGTSVVYIYRDEVLGPAIKMPVLVDGVLAGETGPRSFLQLGLAPGRHTIQSVTEKDVSIDIDTEAGKNYYVWQEVKIGMFSARSALHVVGADTARAGIAKCDLLVTASPAMRVGPSNIVSPVASQPDVAATPIATRTAAPVQAEVHDAPVVSAPPAVGGLAVLDERVSKPVFVAAEDVASRHQCERMLRVRSVDGANAHFYSQCPGTSTPIEILCNGANCHEGAPQG